MTTQKESVYLAFVQESNGQSLSECLSNTGFRAKVVEAVAAGLHEGSVEWDNQDKNADNCMAYASQLVSNWFKRDTRISGVKYQPTTKRGPQVKDEKLAKLNVALKSATVHAPDKVDQIVQMIEVRKAELTTEKTKTKVMSSDELAATLAELGI